MEPVSLMSLALAGRFFTTSATWEAIYCESGQVDALLWGHQLPGHLTGHDLTTEASSGLSPWHLPP